MVHYKEYLKPYHVAESGCSSSQARAAEETLQKPQNNQPGKRVAKSRADREHNEDEECDNIYWVTANEGNLTQGREQERPKTIFSLLAWRCSIERIKTHSLKYRGQD